MDTSIDDLIVEAAGVLRQAGASQVYVFGSAAKGSLRQDSDVDLAVSGLPPRVFFRAMGQAAAVLRRLEDRVGASKLTIARPLTVIALCLWPYAPLVALSSTYKQATAQVVGQFVGVAFQAVQVFQHALNPLHFTAGEADLQQLVQLLDCQQRLGRYGNAGLGEFQQIRPQLFRELHIAPDNQHGDIL